MDLINPLTDGGASIPAPSVSFFFFVDNGKTAERSATKFDMSISTSILRIMRKV